MGWGWGWGKGPSLAALPSMGKGFLPLVFPSSNSFSRNTGWGRGLGRKAPRFGPLLKWEKAPQAVEK